MKRNLRNRITLCVGIGTVVVIIVAGYFPKANSFSGFQGKTLWDWLSLLVVPTSLAALAAWLQHKQQERELKIAEDNRQEEALQHYLDRVSNLLIEKNLLAIVANVARGKNTPEEKELLDVSLDVIRTMTLTVLQRLDGNRKGIVVQFLVESDIIKRPKAILSGANLVGIVLHDANLSGANLSGANLENADLGKAGLGDANLSYTNLVGANLENTAIVNSNLYKADLTGAKLQGAYLWYTYLSGAKLNGAKLEATQILYTDLSDAEGLTEEQLEKTYLCKAKLTEELNIDPNRNCQMFEA